MKNYKKNSELSCAALAVFLFTTGCHHKEAAAPEPPAPPAETTPAPTANITVTPDTITPGQSAALNWTTTNATDVSIDGIGAVETSGTKTVSPTDTTTYHLVARGDGGSTDATATLTVSQAAPPAASSGALTESEFEQNVKPVFFDYDAYTIRSDAQATITQDASFLQSHPNAKILIAGYCDDRGSAEYNLALGQNRANAAKTALVQAGVDASRVRTISYGKEKQFCTEENESCWQQNRRAQFSLDQ
ncbi:MAG: peptidoglycan-associated lipoprotein Pal [Acidobacteriaceae bacterium]